ncbi:hypothetical protein [Cerasibacillus terrae]|uniref:hypothetical protein n=1 Tax=Cerasibacillus terrae TaxID=2498845 RepID=UPI0017472B94|nr:hypothetical protein [Cerasibacillus terrae]
MNHYFSLYGGEIIFARAVGIIARGLRVPFINEGDHFYLEEFVVETVLHAAETEGYPNEDRDIETITESVVDCTLPQRLKTILRLSRNQSQYQLFPFLHQQFALYSCHPG